MMNTSGLIARNYFTGGDVDVDAIIEDLEALTLLVGRENGEDDLGTKVGATTIDFDTGDYWNKKLVANVATLPLTFAATLNRSYEFTIEQDGVSGDREISTTNGTWIGAVEQPATGVGVKSRYRVTKSGATYFISRVG